MNNQRNIKHPLLLLTAIMSVTAFIVFFKTLSLEYFFVFNDVGSDTIQEYVPVFNMIVDKLRAGDLSFWEFNWGLGIDITNNQSLVFDPFNIPIYFAGLIKGETGILYAITVMQIAKSLLTGYLTYFYLSCFGFNEISKVISSYACAFNGFIMLWGQHYFFSTACVILMALILFIEKSLTNKTYYIPLILTVAISFVFSLYTTYMSGIICVIYVLLRLPVVFHKDRKNAFIKLFQLTVCIGISILMSSIISLPAIYQLLNVSSRLESESNLFSQIIKYALKFNSITFIKQSVSRFISNNILGTAGFYFGIDNYYELEQLFFSSLILPFTVIFFAEGCVYSKRKGIYIVAFILFAISFISELPAYILYMFADVATRFSYVFIPLFSLITAYVISNIKRMHKFSLILGWITAVILSVSVLIIAFSKKAENFSEKFIPYYFAIVVCILAAMCIISVLNGNLKLSNKAYRFCSALLIILFVFNVTTDSYFTANERILLERSEELGLKDEKQATEERLEQLNDNTFYRTERGYHTYLSWNTSLILNYQGISYYNTTYNKYVRDFFDKLWPDLILLPSVGADYIYYPKAIGEKQFSSLLGVKYIFIPNNSFDADNDYEFISMRDDIYLYRYKKAAGLGILFDNVINEDELIKLKKLKDRQKAIENAVSIDGEKTKIINKGKFDYSKNSVDFEKNGNDSHLSAQISAETDKTLFVSIPYDKGWKCYVNNEIAPIKKANIGFMAVKLKSGKNKVEFVYSTPLLKEGMIATVIGFVGFFAMAVYLIIKTKKASANQQIKEVRL